MTQPFHPRGKARRFTDAELRADLEAGRKPVEVARKYGVSRQAVSLRVKQLELTTAAAVVAPEESRRKVRTAVDAMEELTRGLQRVNLLQDACDEWLRDPDRPDRYDIGERAEEIEVIYLDQGGEKPARKRAKLSRLYAEVQKHPDVDRILKAESKYADPRTLILSTVQEVRQTVGQMAELARMLADSRIMERFREAVLVEIAKESPEVAGRIADAVRRSLLVGEAFRGPEALPVRRE